MILHRLVESRRLLDHQESAHGVTVRVGMAEEDFERAGRYKDELGRMKLKLPNSDFYDITCPLGDEDKGRCHFRRVTADGFKSFYCKVCADMARTYIDYPDKLCTH